MEPVTKAEQSFLSHVAGRGDFNEIVSSDEKQGGSIRNQRQMQVFRDAIDDSGLTDMGFKGPPFTWYKRRDKEVVLQERLDR